MNSKFIRITFNLRNAMPTFLLTEVQALSLEVPHHRIDEILRMNTFECNSVRIFIDRNLSLVPALSSPNNSRKLTLFAFQLRLSPFKGSCGMCMVYTGGQMSLCQWCCSGLNAPTTRRLLLPLCTYISWTEAYTRYCIYWLFCYPNPIYYRRRYTIFII